MVLLESFTFYQSSIFVFWWGEGNDFIISEYQLSTSSTIHLEFWGWTCPLLNTVFLKGTHCLVLPVDCLILSWEGKRAIGPKDGGGAAGQEEWEFSHNSAKRKDHHSIFFLYQWELYQGTSAFGSCLGNSKGTQGSRSVTDMVNNTVREPGKTAQEVGQLQRGEDTVYWIGWCPKR